MSEEEKLISQDEMDALLSGVEEGAVNLADGDDSLAVDCAQYDLTNKDHVQKASLPGLDAISERFARAFRASAYAALRKPTDVTINQRKIMRFDAFSAEIKEPSSLTVFKAFPLRGTGLIALDPKLVYLVVDTFFGGNGRNFDGSGDRDYTVTEVRVIGIIIDAIINDLMDSWTAVHNIDVQVQSHESNIQMAQVADKSDPVVVCSYNVKTDQGNGDFYVVYPFSMLEAIRDKLEVAASADSEDDDSWAQNLRDQVANAHTEVLCKLSTVELSLRRVLQLRVGDVIPIGEPDQVIVDVEEVPCILGRLGTSKRNLAVSVDKFFNLDEASERAPARSVALLNQINVKRLT